MNKIEKLRQRAIAQGLRGRQVVDFIREMSTLPDVKREN